MRDEKRIEPLCKYLADIWKCYFPDWRFMQLVTNLQIFAKSDCFYMEDSDFKDLINKFVTYYINGTEVPYAN